MHWREGVRVGGGGVHRQNNDEFEEVQKEDGGRGRERAEIYGLKSCSVCSPAERTKPQIH